MSTQLNNTKTYDIEKQSLEAHVDLCAERYDVMKDKMDRMEDRLTNVETIVKQIKDILVEKENMAYRKLLSIGFTIIGSLTTALIGMAVYLLKLSH